MPKKCPECRGVVMRDEGGVIARCRNKDCPARSRERLYHFASRAAFDIVGLGPKIIDKLVDAGLVEDPADFFTLKPGDFGDLEGFGEILSNKLVNQIQLQKEIALPRFIYSLGILHVGEETAALLAQQIPNPPSTSSGSRAESRDKSQITNPKGVGYLFQKISLQELQKIPDIGPVVAKSIYDWFHDRRNLAYLAKLAKAGVRITGDKRYAISDKLKGKTFVFTGGLETMSRDEAKEKVRAFGGDVSESVSQETDYVAAGSEPGSKYEKAKKLGVKILTEQKFLKMIQ